MTRCVISAPEVDVPLRRRGVAEAEALLPETKIPPATEVVTGMGGS